MGRGNGLPRCARNDGPSSSIARPPLIVIARPKAVAIQAPDGVTGTPTGQVAARSAFRRVGAARLAGRTLDLASSSRLRSAALTDASFALKPY